MDESNLNNEDCTKFLDSIVYDDDVNPLSGIDPITGEMLSRDDRFFTIYYDKCDCEIVVKNLQKDLDYFKNKSISTNQELKLALERIKKYELFTNNEKDCVKYDASNGSFSGAGYNDEFGGHFDGLGNYYDEFGGKYDVKGNYYTNDGTAFDINQIPKNINYGPDRRKDINITSRFKGTLSDMYPAEGYSGAPGDISLEENKTLDSEILNLMNDINKQTPRFKIETSPIPSTSGINTPGTSNENSKKNNKKDKRKTVSFEEDNTPVNVFVPNLEFKSSDKQPFVTNNVLYNPKNNISNTPEISFISSVTGNQENKVADNSFDTSLINNPQNQKPNPQPTNNPQNQKPNPQPTNNPQNQKPNPQPTNNPQNQKPNPQTTNILQPTNNPQNQKPNPQTTNILQPTNNPQNQKSNQPPTNTSVALPKLTPQQQLELQQLTQLINNNSSTLSSQQVQRFVKLKFLDEQCQKSNQPPTNTSVALPKLTPQQQLELQQLTQLVNNNSSTLSSQQAQRFVKLKFLDEQCQKPNPQTTNILQPTNNPLPPNNPLNQKSNPQVLQVQDPAILNILNMGGNLPITDSDVNVSEEEQESYYENPEEQIAKWRLKKPSTLKFIVDRLERNRSIWLRQKGEENKLKNHILYGGDMITPNYKIQISDEEAKNYYSDRGNQLLIWGNKYHEDYIGDIRKYLDKNKDTIMKRLINKYPVQSIINTNNRLTQSTGNIGEKILQGRFSSNIGNNRSVVEPVIQQVQPGWNSVVNGWKEEQEMKKLIKEKKASMDQSFGNSSIGQSFGNSSIGQSFGNSSIGPSVSEMNEMLRQNPGNRFIDPNFQSRVFEQDANREKIPINAEIHEEEDELTVDDCKNWIINPNINPKTNRRIRQGSLTYRVLEEACKEHNIFVDIPLREGIGISQGPPPDIPLLDKLNPFKSIPFHCLKTYNPSENINTKEINNFSNVYRNWLFRSVMDFTPKSRHNIPICFSKFVGTIFEKKSEKIYNGVNSNIYIIKPRCGDFQIIKKETALDYQNFVSVVRDESQEVTLRIMINKHIISSITPNYPILYHSTVCDHPKKIGKVKGQGTLTMLFEKFDGSLDEIIYDQNISLILLRNIMLQCILALASGQHIFGLVHGNINSTNFLYKKLQPGGWWRYNFRGQLYIVENLGYFIALNDFDNSYFARPSFSIPNKKGFKNYGNRVVEIVGKDTMPIQYAYHLSDSNNDDEMFVKGFDVYKSFTNDIFNIQPDRDVDLNDLDTFPPSEFMYDNIDLLRMFIGGPAMRVKKNHKHTRLIRDYNLVNLLAIGDNLLNIITTDGNAFMFSGKLLLEQLFPVVKFPDRGEEIAFFGIA
jgi:hypothetical protein